MPLNLLDTIQKAKIFAENYPKGNVPKKDVEFVQNLIGGFQTYEASYRYREERKSYLHSNLSLLELYQRYKCVCTFRKREKWKGVTNILQQDFQSWLFVGFSTERKAQELFYVPYNESKIVEIVQSESEIQIGIEEDTASK